MSVSPEMHMDDVCAAADALQIDMPLVQMPLAVWAPRQLKTVEMDGTELRVAGKTVSRDGLQSALVGLMEAERVNLDEETERVGLTLQVVVSPGASGADLAALVHTVQPAGIGRLQFVVDSIVPVDVPPWPDASYGAELSARLGAAPQDIRLQTLALEIEGLITLCPGAQEVFRAVPMAPPELRCELLAVGLTEALPSCPATDVDKVLTATQILLQPPSKWQRTVMTLVLNQRGELLTFGLDETWADIAARWVKRDGKEVILVPKGVD